MSDEKMQIDDRRKRVQRLKRCIVVTLFIAILVPWVVCGILGVVLGAVKKDVQILQEQNTSLLQELQRIEEQLEKQAESLQESSLGKYPDVLKEQETATGKVSADEVVEVAAQAREPVHRVYLTFDDGPSASTDAILDILKAYEVKATFFVVGKEGEESQAALKRIVEEGHSLGMHSYSHVYNDIYQSVDSFAADLQRIRDYLYEVTGVECKLYRFPGGSSNRVSHVNIRELGAYLQEQGIQYFDWNLSGKDASGVPIDADTILHNCTTGITEKKNAVILLHDAKDKVSTVEALPGIIENILAIPDTVILPITEDTEPVQHIQTKRKE